MGQASNRKKLKQAQKRERPRLISDLREQVQFLEASCNSFDQGFEAEAKRMATVIRVLVHDTGSSHSLMEQLDSKHDVKWVDTAGVINPKNLIKTHAGLMVFEASADGGRYVAPLGDVPPPQMNKSASFDSWWADPVIRDSKEATWSRRDLVTTLANKEGGAHVDPRLNEKYESLGLNNGLGMTWSSSLDAEGTPFEGNAVFAAVRQIAYEVLETISLNETRIMT